MLKRIPKSDISIRPFKAYKQWAFDNDSFEISILEANINSDELSGEYPKNSIYGQLHAQFYNEYIDNPFLRFGHKSVEYKTGSVSERYIDDSAKVISIPQIYVGEGIKKGSVFLKDENLNLNYTDAENGNLILANGDIVNFITFYNQGLIVLTRRSNELLNGNWDLSFKSTKTIYEHEYLLIVNPDEFNISQNPSAIKEVGFEYEFITGSDGKIYKVNTKTGARYIRKKMELENGEVLDFRYGSRINSATSGGFEHWDLSGSVDTTGSFLTPFITTIGLYDDDMDLLAVAKLPQAIKSEPDFPVNFIIRFDI
jgi:hypothetical protein